MNRQVTLVILSLVLSVGALAAVGCSQSTAGGGDPPAAKPGDSPAQAPEAVRAETLTDGVLVYYFHGDRRCPTCLGIQAGIEQAVQERFAAELASRKLVFREINFDEDANKALAMQFQISFSSMVVAWVKGGKTLEWENCDKVWDLAHDAPKLMDYTAERIRVYLAKAGAK
ncbi:MAG TPA: nitrophenyl compound nitroreductase subunit ArsF family protein [Myxococcota bacterium]|nr:nitrophenyl compound nitroreductase subunit ArsF family protein [Myxococcota bacterium]HRY92472.1 nitrophenyl compound nitroreductase subunit ArsF family protein [Myxococcota bacterium]